MPRIPGAEKVLNNAVDELCFKLDPSAVIDRRKHLLRIPPLKRRPALLAIHYVAQQHPKLVARCLGLKPSENIPKYIGHGANSMVFRTRDGVRKVVNRSVLLTSDMLVENAKKLEKEHELLLHNMGEIVVAQSVHIEPHPLFPNRQAIHIYQPFVHIQGSIGGKEGFGAQSERTVQQLSHAPDGLEQLKELVEGGRCLFQREKLVPDLGGEENVVVNEDDKVKIIDGQPLDRTMPENQDFSLGVLSHIEDNVKQLEAAA